MNPFGVNTEYSELCYWDVCCLLFLGFTVSSPLRVFTFGLLLFVEHHQVQGVVEVLGHLDDIVTRQSVCTVYGLVLQVGPIYTILDGETGRSPQS